MNKEAILNKLEDDIDIVQTYRSSALNDIYSLRQFYYRKKTAYENMQNFDNESEYVEICALYESFSAIYEDILRLDNKRVNIVESIFYHMEEE